MIKRLLKQRGGVTLAELMVVMTGCSIILTTSAVIMHRAMRAQSETRHFFDVERSAQRLARQFRQDVERAEAAEIDNFASDAPVFIRLELPAGESIRYQNDSHAVVRSVSHHNKRIAREEYPFFGEVVVTTRRREPSSRLVLSVTRAAPDPAEDAAGALRRHYQIPVWLEVEASLGRAWRLSRQPAPEVSAP